MLRFFGALMGCAIAFVADNHDADWMHYVRIAGHGLRSNNVAQIVEESQRSNVFGIEVDNDIPGRYESFLDPAAKLAIIRAAAERAHAVGNKSFVYIAGWECITAHADRAAHSLYKDHPDWVQRQINGTPALFGGGVAFWVAPGDEDVWVSPFPPEWRARYMSLVRQVAATGIDGVYVDIPYWMTHFTGWEKTWASFDRYTVAAFQKRTGIDARKEIRLDDISDPHFRRWIDFRISAVTDFMKEVNANVKAVNPQCKTIAEIFPGIDESAPVVGADVYELYSVVDAIAHEYQGPSDKMAASKSVSDWLEQMIGMFAFRAFAEGKPTWMLNYSWDGEKNVSKPEAMKTLFAAQLTAGANTWDAQGHIMSGSNDIETRTQVFAWIREHDHLFYDARDSISPIGVYFSPQTRNYFPEPFNKSFNRFMGLLMASHREFQVVTPRTLAQFHGPVLILPDVRCLSDTEAGQLRAIADSGQRLYVSGETGSRQPDGAERTNNPIKALLNIYPSRITWQDSDLERILDDTSSQSVVRVNAQATVICQIARVHGKLAVFLDNFKGILAQQNISPAPENTVEISFPDVTGRHIRALPFLGEIQEIPAKKRNGELVAAIPPFERAMVVWCD